MNPPKIALLGLLAIFWSCTGNKPNAESDRLLGQQCQLQLQQLIASSNLSCPAMELANQSLERTKITVEVDINRPENQLIQISLVGPSGESTLCANLDLNLTEGTLLNVTYDLEHPDTLTFDSAAMLATQRCLLE